MFPPLTKSTRLRRSLRFRHDYHSIRPATAAAATSIPLAHPIVGLGPAPVNEAAAEVTLAEEVIDAKEVTVAVEGVIVATITEVTVATLVVGVTVWTIVLADIVGTITAGVVVAEEVVEINGAVVVTDAKLEKLELTAGPPAIVVPANSVVEVPCSTPSITTHSDRNRSTYRASLAFIATSQIITCIDEAVLSWIAIVGILRAANRSRRHTAIAKSRLAVIYFQS